MGWPRLVRARRDRSGPGPREGAGLAFDADAGKLVLFGGSVGSDQQADTWTWDGTTWSLVAETGPRPGS